MDNKAFDRTLFKHMALVCAFSVFTVPFCLNDGLRELAAGCLGCSIGVLIAMILYATRTLKWGTRP